MTDPLDVPVRMVADGEPTTLRALIGGQPMLVVLTRHLDCPYCEVHVGRVIRSRDELGRVVLVAHGEVEELREHYRFLPAEFLLVCDETQDLYDAFATRRLSKMTELRVRAWNLLTIGVRHMVRGGKISRPGQDLLQLGGDVVVDATGDVAWIHRSQRADDRVPTTELATRMHRAA